VGLEGSDFSKKLRRAEWRTIPEFLFTADITAPFEVVGEFESVTRPVLFDVVTSWEVMEHIHERDLGAVVENVKRHLRPGGLWIMSVAVFDDFQNGINLHQTVKPRQWWIERFAGFGLVNARDYARYFNTQFLRGPKNPRSSTGFQLVLTNDTKLAPPIPAERLPVRIYDRWLGSKVQCILRLALVGVD
jgi:SAM-dependent methyltransferase